MKTAIRRTTARRQPRQTRRRRGFLERLEHRHLLATLTVDTFDDVIDPNDDLTSLREAVIAANQLIGEDTIELPVGDYQMTRVGIDADELDSLDPNYTPSPSQLETASYGDLDIYDDLVIRGLGDSAGETTINGNDIGRVFHFHTGVTWQVQELTLREGHSGADFEILQRNGQVQDGAYIDATDGVGGIIYRIELDTGNGAQHNDPSVPAGEFYLATITSGMTDQEIASAIVDTGAGASVRGETKIFVNRGANFVLSDSQGFARYDDDRQGGGAIRSEFDTIGTVSASVIEDNFTTGNDTSDGGGGGIWIDDATLTLDSGTVVRDNTSFGDGGGLRARGSDIFLSDVSFIGNTSNDVSAFGGGRGGGVSLLFCDVSIVEASFSNNFAENDGGGIYTDGDDDLLSMIRSTVAFNTAGDDGGGAWFGSTLDGEVINTTFSQNVAAETAQQLLVDAPVGDFRLLHTTIVNAQADLNESAVDFIEFGSDRILFDNSIIVGGIDYPGDPVPQPQSVTSTRSILFPNDPTLTATTDFISADPDLEPLADYGGKVLTHRPSQSSPAIDAGNEFDLPNDARGFDRPVFLAPDIGAVERRLFASEDTVRVTVEDVQPNEPIQFNEQFLYEYLLQNDSSLTNEGPLDVRLVSLQQDGSLTIDNGAVTYRPSGDYDEVRYTYTVTDGEVMADGALIFRRIPQFSDRGEGPEPGRYLRSIATYPGEGQLGSGLAKIAVVSEHEIESPQLSIFDIHLETFGTVAVTTTAVNDVPIPDRPSSVRFSPDGMKVAVAAPGGGQNPGAIFVHQQGQDLRTLTAGFSPFDVAIGHFNSDSVDDYASVDFRSGVIGFNDGASGEFVEIGTAAKPVWIRMSDFNRDNFSDLAVYSLGYSELETPSELAVFFGSETGFSEPITSSADAGVVAMDIVDTGGDESPMIVTFAKAGTVRGYQFRDASLSSRLLIDSASSLRGGTVSDTAIALTHFEQNRVEIYELNSEGDYEFLAGKPLASPVAIAPLPTSTQGATRVSPHLFASASLYEEPVSTAPFHAPGSVQVVGLTESQLPGETLPGNLVFFSEKVIEASAQGEGIAALARFDVNADNRVSPADALLVINDLSGPAGVAQGEETAISGRENRRDVNRDGRVTPIDALLIINRIWQMAGADGQIQLSLINPHVDNVDGFFRDLELNGGLF